MSTAEDDNLFDDVDVDVCENAITSDDGNVDSLLKELDSEFAIGGDSDDDEEEDVLDLDGGASDVAAATPSIVESAIDSLVASSSPLQTESSISNDANGTLSSVPPPTSSSEDDSAPEAAAAAAALAPTTSTSVATERSKVDDSVQRLRSSTAFLAQSLSNRTKATADAVDTKYKIRESVSQSVSKLDSDYNIKTKTSSLWSSLKGGVAVVGGSISAGASNVDSRFQLSSKAGEVKSTVAQKAKVATSEIGNAVAPAKEALTELRFGDKISAVGSSVREVDEKFGISTKAVGALADGADALAKGLGKEEGDLGRSGSDASTGAGAAAAAAAAAVDDADVGGDVATPPLTKEV